MKILFVDTTTPDLVVAIVEDKTILSVTEQSVGVRHSETLCLKVQEALSLANISLADLDAYACAIGPGSFTGIRIGVSTLKGYSAALCKPFVAVNCLEAISLSKHCGKRGSAVINAGNGFYYADYLNGTNPCLIPYDDERAESAGQADGAADYLDGATELIRSKFIKQEFDDGLTPLYIRRSQAEERK